MSKRQLKLLNALQLKKFRKQHQSFIVEGEKSVVETLKSTYQIQEVFCTPYFADKYASLLTKIPDTWIVPENDLKKASYFQTNNSSLAVVTLPSQTAPPTLKTNEYALVLDGIQDPGNLGTIIRIADWYSIEQILCSTDTVDLYNPKVIAACMGSFLRVNTYYLDLNTHFTDSQVPLYGAFLDGHNLHEWSFPKRSGYIVLGNESKGIREGLHSIIAEKITIPRFGQAESLNVAMATAVICDHVKRSIS
ncbi:hypothetical protein BKI52_38680 [marine bacterium AO1-C]|nr:hypothetical protein BKI52_38680 [marine bacterium AO1-C]